MTQNPAHQDQMAALKRIEGQIRGVQRMIDEQKYCVDILYQLSAVKGALTQVEDKILEKHLNHCVQNAFTGKSSKGRDEKIKEVFTLIRQTRKGYK